MSKLARTFFAAVFLVGLAGTSRADQIEPFGIQTVATDTGHIADIWHDLKQQVFAGDLRTITSCGSGQSNECAAAAKLSAIVKQARQYQGKAFLGHLNRSINLSIKPGPGRWIGALDALESGVGDCKAYAVTKYVALLAAGMLPDQVRLVIVHNRLGNQSHLVVAVHQDGQWLILDNLHHLILPASDEADYDPLYVLDDHGVRQNASIGELNLPTPTKTRGPLPKRNVMGSNE